MAITDISTGAKAGAPLLAGLGARLSDWFVRLGECSTMARRAREAEALFDLSDEELAKRGLRREEIGYKIFGPNYGL
ncbi:MAG: DUF1127 domain-containing protein [Pseudomonadota bacterium]